MALNSTTEETESAEYIDIPDEFDVTQAEAGAILRARRNGGFEQLTAAIHLASLPDNQKAAMEAIVKGDILGAVHELTTREKKA